MATTVVGRVVATIGPRFNKNIQMPKKPQIFVMSMISYLFAYVIFSYLNKKNTKGNILSEIRFPKYNNIVDHHPSGILF